MRRLLRKTKAYVSVTYSNGYSIELMGINFAVEDFPSSLRFIIDLSVNLRVRNKESNFYYDICELADKHSQLKSVQIDEQQVVDGLYKKFKKIPNASLELQFDLGEKGTFSYSVKPKGSNGNLFLEVLPSI